MIKVRYIDTKKPDEWLPLHDSNGITNNYLISSSVFQNYLSQTKDTNFFKSYTSNSFEDKLMMANFVTSNVNELISGDIDHHGLKYLDKGKPLRYLKAIQTDEKDIWIAKHSDELDRLINRRKIMRFIKQSDKEIGRTESYWNPQLTKKIKNGLTECRVRGCVGGNVSDYDGPTTAYTASLPTVKLLLNAVISEPDAKFMTMDIGDFFLYGSSGRKEYMRIPLNYFSKADMDKYNIKYFIKPTDKSVLVEINGNMYGLVNASLVAQKNLIKLLNDNGFFETRTAQLYNYTKILHAIYNFLLLSTILESNTPIGLMQSICILFYSANMKKSQSIGLVSFIWV